jgi:hypothetical protein
MKIGGKEMSETKKQSTKFQWLFFIVALTVAIFSPIISYVYFQQVDMASPEIKRLQGVIDKLNSEKQLLQQQLEKLSALTKANLVTSIGYYLHPSNDPVPKSRNAFTIYGSVTNTGLMTAYNCYLNITFYSKDNATLQHERITIGIGGILYAYGDTHDTSYGNYNNNFYSIYQRDIGCPQADQVTRIEITPVWSVTP